MVRTLDERPKEEYTVFRLNRDIPSYIQGCSKINIIGGGWGGEGKRPWGVVGGGGGATVVILRYSSSWKKDRHKRVGGSS